MENERGFPTMIIPRGTEITVNDQGQLSIRTPGNLVIQNPGVYSVIECGSGSVRIDPTIKVEAVSIHAADTCLIAGTLTAWRVKAKRIILEKGAQAFIMLRESETLELDRAARLVGNFASEDELYLMMGRFRRQFRELPGGAEKPGPATDELPTGREGPLLGASSEAQLPPDESDAADEASVVEAVFASLTEEQTAPEISPVAPPPEAETQALVQLILERERRRLDLLGQPHDALDRLLELVRNRDNDRLAASFRVLFRQMAPITEDLEQARRMLERQFPLP